MSNFIKVLVKNKLNQLTIHEIISYANEYGFTISQTEANDISTYLKTNDLDPFNNSDRQHAYNELARITNKNTARKAEQLLDKLIQEYGLEYLFY